MNILKITAIIVIATSVLNACGQSIKHAKTESFQVWGNCGMCKKTIESAAEDAKGVELAKWDIEKKTMTVTYDSLKTTSLNIQRAIAATGYDTRLVKGDDQAYANLHECCQYDRKKQ